MALKISILSLLVLVAVVASSPLGFGVDIGGKSQLGGGGSAGGKVGVGLDEGLNVGGKAEGEVHGSWLKSLFGKVYVVSDEGNGIGLGGSVGSDMGGVINGSAAIGGETVIVESNGGARTGLDADAHYRAGANVHFLNNNELASVAHNMRAFTNTQDGRQIETEEAEAKRLHKPIYSKWLN